MSMGKMTQEYAEHLRTAAQDQEGSHDTTMDEAADLIDTLQQRNAALSEALTWAELILDNLLNKRGCSQIEAEDCRKQAQAALAANGGGDG